MDDGFHESNDSQSKSLYEIEGQLTYRDSQTSHVYVEPVKSKIKSVVHTLSFSVKQRSLRRKFVSKMLSTGFYVAAFFTGILFVADAYPGKREGKVFVFYIITVLHVTYLQLTY